VKPLDPIYSGFPCIAAPSTNIPAPPCFRRLYRFLAWDTFSPALAHYTQEAVTDGVWKSPRLSPRDRGLITVAALIARSQTLAMTHYFEKALNSGVKASELSELILHLAFYSGFPNAMAAVGAAKDAFHKRGISAQELRKCRKSYCHSTKTPSHSALHRSVTSVITFDAAVLNYSSKRSCYLSRRRLTALHAVPQSPKSFEISDQIGSETALFEGKSGRGRRKKSVNY
jgi:alkylhydroperoxidase/carboxymuconolactone decarboxylase family protein YurZ